MFGALTCIEYMATVELKIPRNKYERKMMKIVNDSIHAISPKGDIKIKLGNYTFSRVIGMNANFTDCEKADVSLVGIVNDSIRDIAFISYKKTGGAKAFQQYSGLSKRAGEIINSDPLVLTFLESAAQHIRQFNDGETVAQKGTPAAYQHVPKTQEGELLIRRAVFGHNYAPIDPHDNINGNSQNVHIIAQGEPTLKQIDIDTYELSFSDHVYNNNDPIDWACYGDYTAVFAGTYRYLDGRGFFIGDTRYSNFRVGVYPLKILVTRKSMEV